MMDLPGIPDSIPFERVQEMLTSLGLPIDQITTEGVHVGWEAIQCTIFAVNADGRRYINRAADEIATHRISIRIDHGTPEATP